MRASVPPNLHFESEACFSGGHVSAGGVYVTDIGAWWRDRKTEREGRDSPTASKSQTATGISRTNGGTIARWASPRLRPPPPPSTGSLPNSMRAQTRGTEGRPRPWVHQLGTRRAGRRLAPSKTEQQRAPFRPASFLVNARSPSWRDRFSRCLSFRREVRGGGHPR